MNKLVVIMSCATFMFTAYCMPWTFAQEQIDRKPPMRKVVDPETSAREITDKMKDELEQVNRAVMRGQVLPIHQEMTHVWMMDSYTRTVRMQKVFLNN